MTEREAIFGIGIHDGQQVTPRDVSRMWDEAGAFYAEARRGGNTIRRRLWLRYWQEHPPVGAFTDEVKHGIYLQPKVVA